MQQNKFSKEEEREKRNSKKRRSRHIGHIYHSSFMTRLEQPSWRDFAANVTQRRIE